MLPHADHAIIDEAKICDDLLSDTHPVGRFKARVLHSLGYTVESWTGLRDDLLHHGQTGSVERIEMSAYGMKVVISATLKGPNGASRAFRTVWMIPDQSRQPRLVTAFPVTFREGVTPWLPLRRPGPRLARGSVRALLVAC